MTGDMAIQILCNLLSIPLGATIFYILVDNWRFPRVKVRCALFGVFVLFFLANAAVIFYTGLPSYLKYIITVVNLPALYFVLQFLSAYQKGHTFFLFCTTVAFLQVGTILGEIFAYDSTLWRLCLRLFIYTILTALIYRFLRPALHVMLEEMDRGWYLMSLIPLTLLILCLLLICTNKLYYDRQLQVVALVLCAAVCGAYTAFYGIFSSLKHQFTAKSAYDLLQSQMTALQKQADSLQAANGRLNIFHADMERYLDIQHACFQKGDLDGAHAVLSSVRSDMAGTFQSWQVKLYTNLPLIDAVLSDYAARAKSAGVALEICLSLPDPLPFDPSELAVVLSNGLENALNACLKLPQDYPRAIRLTGLEQDGRLYLELRNTFDGKVQFSRGTQRPIATRAGHGYGTQSVAAFAEKYHAVLQYEVKDGWFSLRLSF